MNTEVSDTPGKYIIAAGRTHDRSYMYLSSNVGADECCLLICCMLLGCNSREVGVVVLPACCAFSK